ncbi:MAG TPA: hypothetical protein VN228_08470, partial [Pyrinomonadaceae bacterium]|nr:hypothetical protein [Pyrinomonadaceae bacterium]
RAASLYFRYGGAATTALRGARLLGAVGSLRWSGLAAHATAHDLTSLASNYARDRATERFASFGVLGRVRQAASAARGVPRPVEIPRNISVPRPSVNVDVEERLLDRLDPASQLERLSRFLWRRRRLAALRGQWMYFYTDLRGAGRGLAGVNLNNGETGRAVRLSDPDERFISDESAGLLYVSQDERLFAHPLDARQ